MQNSMSPPKTDNDGSSGSCNDFLSPRRRFLLGCFSSPSSDKLQYQPQKQATDYAIGEIQYYLGSSIPMQNYY